MRHIIDGYDYAMSRGWDEVARVCLTHSFPIQDVDADIGKKDVTAGQYEFIRSCLNRLEYDDYDRLIILCDSLASADGFCILEKRFVDTARRYGLFRLRLRAGKTCEYKAYFEAMAGAPIYTLLPGIEKCLEW